MGSNPRHGARVVLLLVTALLLAGCAGSPETTDEPRQTASTTPSATLRSMPAWDPGDGDEPVPIESGTYLIPSSPWAVADFRVTFPEGWTVQYGHVFARHADQRDEFGFYAVVVDEIYTDSCGGEEGISRKVGPGVEALVDALLEQVGGAATSEPVTTTLGGRPATRIDLRIPKGLHLDRCRLGPWGLQVWYSEPADKYFVLLPGAVARVYIVTVGGERQVFLAQVGDPRSAEDRAELRRVLDSIRFKPAV